MAIFQQAVGSSGGFSTTSNGSGSLDALLAEHKRNMKDASSEVVKTGMDVVYIPIYLNIRNLRRNFLFSDTLLVRSESISYQTYCTRIR